MRETMEFIDTVDLSLGVGVKELQSFTPIYGKKDINLILINGL